MMRYTTFRRSTRTVLKVSALLMVFILAVGSVVGIAYLSGGIRAVVRLPLLSLLIGVDRQADLKVPPPSPEEISELRGLLGMEVEKVRPGMPTHQGNLAVSTGQFAYLLETGGQEADLFQDIQVRVDDKDGQKVLSVSTVADAVAVALTVGYTEADMNSVVGPLPENVAILAELVVPENTQDDTPLRLSGLRIGQVTLSKTMVDSANAYLKPTLEAFFEKQFGIGLENLTIDGQTIVLQGNMPSGTGSMNR